jgi:CBS domain-containing protein
MTAPPVTIDASRPVTEAAKLMTECSINRLPVAREGRLAGIVTRSDLVKAFVRPDDEIRAEIVEDVLVGMFWLDHDAVEVTVSDGRVTLAGEVDTAGLAELIPPVVGRVLGVVAVTSRLTAPGAPAGQRIAPSVR